MRAEAHDSIIRHLNADAARVPGAAPEPSRQETRIDFRRRLPEAREDLESLTTLGRLEMGA